MKYKIVIVNYAGNENVPEIIIYKGDRYLEPWNKWETTDAWKQEWEDGKGWFALNLYGVHIFETDNLGTFDLLEAQEQKDEAEMGKVHNLMEAQKQKAETIARQKIIVNDIGEYAKKDMPSTLPPSPFGQMLFTQEETLARQRKAEIKRIAEVYYIKQVEQDCSTLFGMAVLRQSVKNARIFVDNFDAEFEKLEGEK